MFIKITLDELSPIAIAWLRLGSGALLIMGVAVIKQTALPREAKYWRDTVIVGAFASAIPFCLIPIAEQEVSSQLAGILTGVMPLWAALLSHCALAEERLDRVGVIGILIGFLGLAIVIGPGIFDIGSASTQGALLIVLAALSYAAGAVWVRRQLHGVNFTLLAGNQTLLAFLFLTPLVVANGAPNPLQLSTNVLGAMLMLGFLATGVGYVIYYWLLSTLHATQVSLLTYLAPVAAVFWGWAILNETLGYGFLPGAALILLSLYFVNQRASTQPNPCPQATH